MKPTCSEVTKLKEQFKKSLSTERPLIIALKIEDPSFSEVIKKRKARHREKRKITKGG